MPFYGRYINNVILTTGGGLLTGSINDASTELQIPSYIAPFLTGMPPSDRDTVIFNDTLDKGGEFVLQWDKHHGPDDKNLRLQVQLRILLDGTLSFLYKNFHQAILDVIDDKGYPLAIGLKDGFAVINTNATKGTIVAKYDCFFSTPFGAFTERKVYTYPDYSISPDQVVNHPLGLVTLAPIEGLCKTKSIDECTNECTRCQNECLYNMELHRSGSACNVQGSSSLGFSFRFMHMFLPLQRNVTRNVLKLTSLFAVRMGLRIPTNVTSNTRRAFTRRKSLSGTKVNVKFKMTAVLAPKTTNPSVALIM